MSLIPKATKAWAHITLEKKGLSREKSGTAMSPGSIESTGVHPGQTLQGAESMPAFRVGGRGFKSRPGHLLKVLQSVFSSENTWK